MQHRYESACVLLLAVPLMACSTAKENAVAVSNERLDEAPSDPGRTSIGDEAASGQGLSRVSLGVLGETEMRSTFVHVFQQASSGNPEKVLLSYSAVFANGDALSLTLPYVGDAATFDAASMPIGGDGLMWSANGEDMFSTRGSFEVEQTDSGIKLHITDLLLTKPLQPADSLSVSDGVIEGQVERRCLLAKPRSDGLTGPDGPAASYELDPTWTSDFCARFR